MSDLKKKKKNSKKGGPTFILAGFTVDGLSSEFYRKYKHPCSLAKNVQKLVAENRVDFISIRIVGRPKLIPLTEFLGGNVIAAKTLEYSQEDIKDYIDSEIKEVKEYLKEEEE